ncbi:unnamed protein product [Onchocerca ochengi]|uniref:Uncharacterized protein n=1 Tax=Onchocerca ochengi TaxID=42157 RepID=A0A182ED93_ONCOC|nr:unnamed protein product [Onchocerca ochengi]
MDDNLADYRRFCANRLKRLERCKKTKSFCNLDDEVPYSVNNTDSDLVLRGSEIFALHGGSTTFSVCSENAMFSSAKPERVPFCSRTSTYCSGSKVPLVTDTPRFGSTGISSMNIMSSMTETNPKKLSLAANSWLEKSQKSIPINGDIHNRHLSPFSCSSPYSSSTTASSTIASQSSILSMKNPESEMRTTITIVNNNNDYGDSNRRAQRNFDLLREKMVKFTMSHNFKAKLMNCCDFWECLDAYRTYRSPLLGNVCNYQSLIYNILMGGDTFQTNNGHPFKSLQISLMENDVRLLQQLLALGDSIQELKSKSQVHGYSQLSLNSLEEENDDNEEWCSSDEMKTTFSNSLSAVTNLYVDDEPKENQNKQYFSRKNSVLRIPIPPKSSNRMSTNEKLVSFFKLSYFLRWSFLSKTIFFLNFFLFKFI